ncbi:MAG: LamG domain-containing protein [candidate division KSB1 bacterium]|nr:LamG domain-containing protein [candidate division KSB1 bacterium]MDZ7273929.1 LamG domain-containing protein [candidate division KSB1 bacterium]MDZ7286085.1 LamG domain-containing protein [candidate division KSB1 bacterium]MDZ7299117.1 LamG domain-containing protein [candidate division KSB1 bacterium]MDZ7306664.1 LamG domain-containing protein [candidate division KSB1 bacterium]
MKRVVAIATFLTALIVLPLFTQTSWRRDGCLTFSGPMVVEQQEAGWWFGLFSQTPLRRLERAALALRADTVAMANWPGFTIEFWFQEESNTPATLLALLESGSGRVFCQLRRQAAELFTAEVALPCSMMVLTAAAKHAAQSWRHLALVCERLPGQLPQLRLFLDGTQLVSRVCATMPIWPGRFVLHLGGGTGVSHFAGKLDEVRISAWPRYRAAGFQPARPLLQDHGTLGLWDFDTHQQAGIGRNTQHPADGWQRVWQEATSGARLAKWQIGRSADQGLEIRWQTAREDNLHGFEIQRRPAAAAVPFAKVGYVPATGTSTQNVLYHFIDYPDSSGVYAYRLKCVDRSGQAGYSAALIRKYHRPRLTED